MQTEFLLGPAGSGKTSRCLAALRQELLARPDGPPLLLLAPKQATFQLERQLLATPELQGYTRLHILSFDRLAEFVLTNLGVVTPTLISEEGRVMVLRALLLQRQQELKIFHATARLTGFARQLSLLLRDFQRHQLSPPRLASLAGQAEHSPTLRNKLHDLALLLRAYQDWLKTHELQDASQLLDVAAAALQNEGKIRPAAVRIEQLWLDGFAEMTPQEMELLAALGPHCGAMTLAFCLEREPAAPPSWLSTWAVVAQTFRRCHARLTALEGNSVTVTTLESQRDVGRFAHNESLRDLEANWSRSAPPADPRPRCADASIALVTCADAEAETVFAAREIHRHVRAGGRYRDCAVIVRSLLSHQALLARTFRRYEIPFFLDAREPVAHHPLAELTRFALRTVAFNWRQEDWFGALKTGLVVAETEVDWLENLALERGWEGAVWQQALISAADGAVAEPVEYLRRKIMPPFLMLAQRTQSGSVSGPVLAVALRELWRELRVETTLTRWSSGAGAERPAQTHQSVSKQLAAWLGDFEHAFAGETLPLRDWLPIIEAGLANLTVGVVPPALDQVLIGAIDRSRNPEIKLACLLGCNEGLFPAPPPPARLLTETDRAQLEQADIYLGPSSRQLLGHERYLGYIAVTRASERLVVTRALRDATDQPLNPSPFFDHLQRLTGRAEIVFDVNETSRDPVHGSELAGRALQVSGPEREWFNSWPALQPLLTKAARVAAAEGSHLSPAVVAELYSDELTTSVSRLEEFVACPFQFFATSGLRLRDRAEFQFEASDKGSFQHEVLHHLHRRLAAGGKRWRDWESAAAVRLVGEIARDLLPNFLHGKFSREGAARYTGELLIARLERLIATLFAWWPQYQFDPVASELGFDDQPDSLPAWRLDLTGGRRLKLTGRIDRVDLFHQPDGSALAVVLDYKSRAKRLDATKLYHGLELQLLSYLGVLRQARHPEAWFGVKSLTPAGVFYVPLNGGADTLRSRRGEIVNRTASQAQRAYQHNGRFLAEAWPYFDARQGTQGDQFRFKQKQDGSLSQVGNDALPAPEFDALRETVGEHLRGAAEKIFSGTAAPAPYRLKQATPCDYCELRPVCRFDPWTQPFRLLAKPPRDE